jgi:hypothetical protein
MRAGQGANVKIAIALLSTFVLAGPACALAAQAPAPSSPATSSDPAPTADSIRQLLQMTDIRKIADALPAQMKAMYSGMIQKMLEGQTVSSEQQQVIDTMLAKMEELMREEMSWETLEPLYIKIYQDTFTQSEIDGMMAFYSTPAGQAVIHKLPLAMQNTMTAVQQHMMNNMLPKIQQMVQDVAKQIKAQPAKNKSGG